MIFLSCYSPAVLPGVDIGYEQVVCGLATRRASISLHAHYAMSGTHIACVQQPALFLAFQVKVAMSRGGAAQNPSHIRNCILCFACVVCPSKGTLCSELLQGTRKVTLQEMNSEPVSVFRDKLCSFTRQTNFCSPLLP